MQKFIPLIIIAGVAWAWQSGHLMSTISQFKSIESKTCRDLENIAMTMDLRNMMGASFSIVRISGSEEVSRSATEIICHADGMLDNGMSPRLLMKAERMPGGDVSYLVEVR